MNDRSIVIGYMTGMSGSLNGKRLVKVDDKKDPVRRHIESHRLLDELCEKHDIFEATSWAFISAVFTWHLYNNGKLTRTVAYNKPERTEGISPVSKVLEDGVIKNSEQVIVPE